MLDQYELDYEFDNAKVDEEFEIPDMLDSWTLDDFGDVLSDSEDFSF